MDADGAARIDELPVARILLDPALRRRRDRPRSPLPRRRCAGARRRSRQGHAQGGRAGCARRPAARRASRSAPPGRARAPCTSSLASCRTHGREVGRGRAHHLRAQHPDVDRRAGGAVRPSAPPTAPIWTLDEPLVNERILPGFLGHALGATGVLYWRIDAFGNGDPWTIAPSWRAGPIRATVSWPLYPGSAVGVHGVVPSPESGARRRGGLRATRPGRPGRPWRMPSRRAARAGDEWARDPPRAGARPPVRMATWLVARAEGAQPPRSPSRRSRPRRRGAQPCGDDRDREPGRAHRARGCGPARRC